jgi:redox-sensitive bicupin YhaK (pirin superfamily)
MTDLLEGHKRDLGGFFVERVLPQVGHRSVGPFVFLDHMGPASFEPGHGLDVRPHPHIGLATVTYLYEGEIVHRDSLGSLQPIRPGAINWMTAGRGIVHSERTAADRPGGRLHGLQLWVALPLDEEECEPAFAHHPADTMPTIGKLRLLAGTGWGARSPVIGKSPLFFADAQLDRGDEVVLPDEHAERGVYVVEGEVLVDGVLVTASHLAVGGARVIAQEPSRVALLGGAPLEAPRHMFWNFVSSSRERIERAKDDWRARRFPLVPGDEIEFTPLPS